MQFRFATDKKERQRIKWIAYGVAYARGLHELIWGSNFVRIFSKFSFEENYRFV